jgi:predicted Fe-Mo cluster-binding NifX family protein
MRIAVTYEDGQIFQHFGHTERFKIYDVADGEIRQAATVSTNGSGHGALADILRKLDIDTLICGGIGGGAQRALAEAGIQLYGGVQGSADVAVQSLLAGTLSQNDQANCDHHGHHSEGHACGSHGCGSHSCGHE